MKTTQACLIVTLLATFCSNSTGLTADRRQSYGTDTRVMLDASGAMVTAERRSLHFYDQDGKLRKSRELRGNEYAILPEGGSVVGITRFGDNSPSTLTPVAFELVDLAGKRRYGIERPHFSSVVISPTGAAVVGIDGAEGLPQSVLRFYDELGKEVHTMTVEYFLGGRFSANGHVFIFGTAKDGLLAYSASGQALARYGPGSVYDLSANGDVFVVAQDSVVRVYSGGKRLTTVHADESVRTVTVSADGTLYGWAGVYHAAFHKAGTDSALCRIELSAPGENFRSLAISDDGRHLAAGIDIEGGRELPPEERHTRGRAVVYDLTGRKIADKELTYQAWNARTPVVSFTHNGHALTIMTREEAYILELPAPAPAQ